ncbi:type II toxin-antitoxin system HicB family antitoxin [Candidatus Woesearchaeota archaeon]|nr:type II toxin-antitoxin system HicB family antitoxin [Candidatus Woesearchaeota archaeon]
MAKIFHVIIERDEDGAYVGKVAELHGCLSQGGTLDELRVNIKESIELCLEIESENKQKITEEQIKFIGIQEIESKFGSFYFVF